MVPVLGTVDKFALASAFFSGTPIFLPTEKRMPNTLCGWKYIIQSIERESGDNKSYNVIARQETAPAGSPLVHLYLRTN